MKKNIYFLAILSLLVFTSVTNVLAQTTTTQPPCIPGNQGYCLLAPLPVISDTSGKADITGYIPGMYKLLIGLAGVLAVLKLIFAGIKYMSTDAFSGKENSKDDIRNALVGLLLTFSAWIILYTVNPKLVEFNLTIPAETSPSQYNTGLGTDIDQAAQDTNYAASGCSGCAPLPNKNLLPQKDVAPLGSTNGACKYPGPCVAAAPLIHELVLINQVMGNKGWQITEVFPPTVPHKSICHSNGTCADVTVEDKSIPGLIKFFTAVKNSGASSYLYEVCGDPVHLATLMQNKDLADLKVKFSCESTTTGSTNSEGKVSESAHINM